MTEALLWLHGIGWDTPIRQIGWTWVLLALSLAAVIWMAFHLFKLLGAFDDVSEDDGRERGE